MCLDCVPNVTIKDGNVANIFVIARNIHLKCLQMETESQLRSQIIDNKSGYSIKN